MIMKIKRIDNFAVFNGFQWDNSVIDANGKPLNFEKINILYGRNYSGKTTLSKAIRALETRTLPDKYDNPQFEIILSDNQVVTQDSLATHNLDVHVFNKDFVRANLHFLSDPDTGIMPFAILGSDNDKIEKEIQELEYKLGSNEAEDKSGLYYRLSIANTKAEKAASDYTAMSNELEDKISDKAIHKQRGIKYNFLKFGDQNYTTAKLKTDIQTALSPTYSALSDTDKIMYENIAQEQPKSCVNPIRCLQFSFSDFCQQAEELLDRKISASSKIQELLFDTAISSWIREGMDLLEGKKICAFCGNTITDERWEIIHSHFDESLKRLEIDIDSLVARMETEKERVARSFTVDKNQFYCKYHQRIDTLIEKHRVVVKQYIDSLGVIIDQLNNKKGKFTVSLSFISPEDNTCDLKNVFVEYASICKEQDDYSNNLEKSQGEARKVLRLQEVYDYCNIIGYSLIQEKITILRDERQNAVWTFPERVDSDKSNMVNPKRREPWKTKRNTQRSLRKQRLPLFSVERSQRAQSRWNLECARQHSAAGCSANGKKQSN